MRTTRTGKREGMAPMQWRDATVGGRDTAGFEASGSVAQQERSDIRHETGPCEGLRGPRTTGLPLDPPAQL